MATFFKFSLRGCNSHWRATSSNKRLVQEAALTDKGKRRKKRKKEGEWWQWRGGAGEPVVLNADLLCWVMSCAHAPCASVAWNGHVADARRSYRSDRGKSVNRLLTDGTHDLDRIHGTHGTCTPKAAPFPDLFDTGEAPKAPPRVLSCLCDMRVTRDPQEITSTKIPNMPEKRKEKVKYPCGECDDISLRDDWMLTLGTWAFAHIGATAMPAYFI